MLSSSKIIKGRGKTPDCRILELRHSFIKEVADIDQEPAAEQSEPGLDPAQAASRIMEEAAERAQKIVSEAETFALEIKENTLKIAEEEAERIKRDSREEGLAEGRKEALARAAADASSIRDQARLVLRQAEEIRRQTIDSLEPEILQLAIDIAEKVISANLAVEPQVVMDIAGEAIGMLHNRDQVVLFVNPDQVTLFQERREELQKLISPKGELHIISDQDIGSGGCIAETEYGRVDARLDERWDNLLRALKEFGR